MNKGITALLALSLVVSFSMGQGSLTPPGPPASTMKTLDQIDSAIGGVSNAMAEVEARTPISEAGFGIMESGSYYLTTNLYAGTGQSGIRINADDVTLDLNGFTIDGMGSSESGIVIGGHQYGGGMNVLVKNGSIRGFGKHGISGGGIFRNLRLSFNATGNDPYSEDPGPYYAINCNYGLVENCVFEANGNGVLVDGKATGNMIFGGSSGVGITVGVNGYVSDNVVNWCSVGFEIMSDECIVVRNTAINCSIAFSPYESEITNGVATVRTSPVGAGAWDNFDIKNSGSMP